MEGIGEILLASALVSGLVFVFAAKISLAQAKSARGTYQMSRSRSSRVSTPS
jgi:hypothetical protein